jgi:hypothetical protein
VREATLRTQFPCFTRTKVQKLTQTPLLLARASTEAAELKELQESSSRELKKVPAHPPDTPASASPAPANKRPDGCPNAEEEGTQNGGANARDFAHHDGRKVFSLLALLVQKYKY